MGISYLFFFFFFFFWGAAGSHASEIDAYYTNCSRPFLCGNSSSDDFINTTYPFWGNDRPSYCGLAGFELECRDGEYSSMDFEGQRYRVLGITRKPDISLVMRAARNDLWIDPCLRDQTPKNTSMDNNTQFEYASGVKNLSIFYCSSPTPELLAQPYNVSCHQEGYPNRSALFVDYQDLDKAYIKSPNITNCESMIKVPMLDSAFSKLLEGYTSLHRALDEGFELEYRVDKVCMACESSGGMCGTSSSPPYNFVCYCSDKPHPYGCYGSGTLIPPYSDTHVPCKFR